MSYNHSGGSCGCANTCNTCPQTNPCQTKCLGQITQAMLGDLVYIAGLDINLCKKYSTIIDALGLVDCAGNPITAATQIVTCAAFEAQLCTILAGQDVGAPVAAGTLLIGADCAKHAMPAFQPPITILDTPCIDITLAANVLSAVPILNPAATNILECTPTGLNANVCEGISLLPVGAPATAGTPLIGVDCLTHAFPPFQAPLSVADTSCIDLTLAGNILSAVPIISPVAGNQLSCTAQGLYALETTIPDETPIIVTDSSSIDLTASGPVNHNLTAVVKISTDPGNSTVITPTGVYTPSVCEQFLDIGGIVNPTLPGDIFITRNCIPRTIVSGAVLSVADTVTINHTLVGGVLSSDVNISGVAGNILEVRVDGLAVRCADVIACLPDVNIATTDTSCLNLDVVEAPSGTFTISGNPIISPAAGNGLSCTAQGLFSSAAAVTCASITGLFTDLGTPLVAGDAVLTDACTSKNFPTISGLDSFCIQTDVIPSVTGLQISSNPILAPTHPTFPAACNGLVCGPTGLSAPPNSTHNYGQILITPGEGFWFQGGALTVGVIQTSPLITLNISNPSTCRSALLEINMVIPGAGWDSDANFGIFKITGFHAFNLPGVEITALNSFTSWSILGAIGRRSATPPGDRSFFYTVPPGFVGSYSVQWQAVAEFANATNSYVGNIGARYSLHTI